MEPFAYSTKFVAGGQYPLVCRRQRSGEDEHVLLDGNVEAEGKAYWDLGGFHHSPDHKLLAYASDDKGSELYTIRVRDLATGKDLADSIPDTRGGVVWANDSKTLFYVRLDEHHRPLLVYRHVVGTPVEDDVLVYAEKDIGFYVAISSTQSAKYVLIDAHDHQTSEAHLIDADAPLTAPRVVEPRKIGHEYSVEHHGDKLIITTNSQGAEDFRIVEAPVADPRMANWREIIAHRPGCLVLDTILYREHMVRLERENGLPRIVVRRLSRRRRAPHRLPGGGLFSRHLARLRVRHHDDAFRLLVDDDAGRDLRLRYGDARTHAAQTPAGAERTQPVRLRHAPALCARRRWRDRARVDPLSPAIRRSTARRPCFSTATARTASPSQPRSRQHGCRSSTAASSTPSRTFAAARTRAITGTRTASCAHKVNTFTDFIAAGEFLVDQGLTRRGRIVANGGSAGGMLMGVVANMAPELFLGIIADVPFVDVLNTMLDKDLPLTPPEWPEWGNPITRRDEFETIHSYSPYENVEAKAYPHIFAYGGLTDPRVTYWEPAKWVARLRDKNTSDNLILLKINMEAGHGGASGRYEQLREMAADYAFALKIAGPQAPAGQKERAA